MQWSGSFILPVNGEKIRKVMQMDEEATNPRGMSYVIFRPFCVFSQCQEQHTQLCRHKYRWLFQVRSLLPPPLPVSISTAPLALL